MNYTVSEKYFKLFSDLIYEKSGINIHNGKKELLQARIAKILRREKLKDYKELYEKVKNDKSGRYLTLLLNSISTNKTSFFREEKHFKFLSSVAIKELENRKNDYTLRCWSAGCSSGEEVYSIAITVLESLKNPDAWKIKILGTDLSYDVLNTATKGIYPYESVSFLPKNKIQKYFIVNNGQVEVDRKLKNIVIFRWLNLMQPFPFRNKLDFIFCRNVMIYFDKKTKENLIKRLYDCLDYNGYLFIGMSESLTGIKHNFKYIMPSVYKKV
ncbi:hypothetical protein DRQ09_01075 [candidate division KSB1 bacterium]|nr:MAG: hypothetical protein DRQ09_01075 [candidate division KSB1 bacterium]